MNLQNLKDRFIDREFSGYGHYKVTMKYRGVARTFVTTNMAAIDRINCDTFSVSDGQKDLGYTLKQAYSALWREMKSTFKK